MPALDSALELIGAVVVAGGGLALITYQAFKHLAAKWLDARFEERLQDLRHKHERELEQLRFEIKALLDRTTKLNEKEFAVLPEAWAKLHAGFWQARELVSRLQSYPDLERMSSSQLEEFLGASGLDSWQTQEVRAAPRKNKVYQNHIYWYRLNETLTVLRDTSVYLAKSGIFMLPDIRQRFTQLANMALDAVNEDQFNHQHEPRPLIREKIETFVRDGEAKLVELERVVHTRLWPS